jgi:DNA-binding LytR/AlgR family response regulator
MLLSKIIIVLLTRMEWKCLVVDDDEMVRIDLEAKLAMWTEVQLVGMCTNAIEALRTMQDTHIDIIFLDVNMPGMTGFQFLKTLEDNNTQVVIMTSNKDYAVDAFEYDVADFMVKPFTEDRFAKTMLKLLKRLKQQPVAKEPQAPSTEYLFVKVNKIFEKISYNDILFIEALADYVQIQTNAKKFTIHSTMKSMEQSLPEKDFMRVHNSFIVRLDKISRIEDNSIMISSQLVPVSRNKVKPLMQRINTL